MRKSFPRTICLFVLTALILVVALMLSACSTLPSVLRLPSGAKTPEELAEKYLSAIMNEKYEDVLKLLPEEIIQYGMDYLDGDREDVVDFVKYAAYDYYWLSQLPTHINYSYEITEIGSAMPEQAREQMKKDSLLIEEDGVKLYVQDMVGMSLSIDVGAEEPVQGSLFIIKTEDRWYLISVAGDDEIFVY